MRKVYMKPNGKVVALRVNENISTSGVLGWIGSDQFGVHYNVVGDKRYIYTSNYESVNTKDESYNAFYDLIISYLYKIDPACRFDPDAENPDPLA